MYEPDYDVHASIEERRAKKSLMATEKENAKKGPKVQSKVLVSRERVTIDELPSNIQAYAKLLPAGVFHAMHSRTWHEGAVFKTGARAGEKRPDKTIEHYAIGHEGKNPLTAVWSGGTLQYAKGVLNGELRWTEKATELGAWLKGEWE